MRGSDIYILIFHISPARGVSVFLGGMYIVVAIDAIGGSNPRFTLPWTEVWRC